MTIDEFATVTQRIIKRDGFDGYLPTLYFPARSHIMVLEGIPDEKQFEIRDVALKWAVEKAQGGEEFLLAFKVGFHRFCIIRRHESRNEEAIFESDAK